MSTKEFVLICLAYHGYDKKKLAAAIGTSEKIAARILSPKTQLYYSDFLSVCKVLQVMPNFLLPVKEVVA